MEVFTMATIHVGQFVTVNKRVEAHGSPKAHHPVVGPCPVMGSPEDELWYDRIILVINTLLMGRESCS